MLVFVLVLVLVCVFQGWSVSWLSWRPWANLAADIFACCSISFRTIVLILVPSFYALVLAAPTLHPLIGLGCFGTFLTLIISFTVTAFSDPGIIKKQTRAELEQSIRPKEGSLCERCHIYRPPMAYHCRDCDACIREHDHRMLILGTIYFLIAKLFECLTYLCLCLLCDNSDCPWTGKCIGERNLTSFYIFIASLFVHFIYVGKSFTFFSFSLVYS